MPKVLPRVGKLMVMSLAREVTVKAASSVYDFWPSCDSLLFSTQSLQLACYLLHSVGCLKSGHRLHQCHHIWVFSKSWHLTTFYLNQILMESWVWLELYDNCSPHLISLFGVVWRSQKHRLGLTVSMYQSVYARCQHFGVNFDEVPLSGRVVLVQSDYH